MARGNGLTVDVEIPRPDDHLLGEWKIREILGGQDHLPLRRNGQKEGIVLGRPGRGARAGGHMTPAKRPVSAAVRARNDAPHRM